MNRPSHFQFCDRHDAARVTVIVCVCVALGIASVAAGIVRVLSATAL